MQGARRGSVAAAALLGAVLAAPSAWAFHAGPTFDKPATAGGAEAIYYAGAPVDHGWTCTQCHQNPPGKITLHVTQAELFTGGGQQPYVPGQKFDFVVDLKGEHLGLESPKANYNGLVVQVLTQDGLPAGALLHADDMVDTFGASTIISAGIKPGQTQWKFTWFAPGPTEGVDGGPPGKVTFYLAAVDGNGANSGPTGAEQDPFGDDVFTVAVTLDMASPTTGALAPAGAAPAALAAAAATTPGRDVGLAAPVLASMVGLAMVGMSRRRRRR